MKRFFTLASITVLSAVSCLALIIGATMHFDPLCGEQLDVEKISPDGNYVASTMARNCGATTSYVDHVKLRATKAPFRPEFFGGTITEDEVLTVDTKYGHIDGVEWIGPRKLSIEFNSLREFVRGNDTWRDVSIEYPGHKH